MDVSHSGSSSEQSSPQQGEAKELLSSQKTEADTEEVQLHSQDDDNNGRHSVKMSDSDNHKMSQGGSSCAALHANGSSQCGVGTVTQDSGEQCDEDSSSGGVNDSQSWFDPSMLLDNSVEEFSITAERNKDNINFKEVYLKQTLDEMSSVKESILCSTREEESEPRTHSIDNKVDAELGQAEQAEGKHKASPHAGTENPTNPSCLQDDIHSLLSATASLCSPSSDLEVGRVDFSTTPKENLMRMVSDLLDECDWLKKEKAR